MSSAADSLRLLAARDMVLQRLEREGRPVTASELEAAATGSTKGIPGVDRDLLQQILADLVECGDVHYGERHGEGLYFLSDRCRAEMRGAREENDRRCRRVLRDLFGFAADVYRGPFLEVVYSVLDSVAAQHVLDLASGEPLRSQKARATLRRAVERVARENEGIDPDVLARAVLRFFEKTELDFAFLKFRTVQGFFVLKLLGLDPDSLLFTRKMFAGVTFLIDTNLAIDALEPERGLHKEFRLLAETAEAAGFNLAIAAPTLKELRGWLTTQRGSLQRVEAGDAAAAETVDRDVLRRYDREKAADPDYDLDALFGAFENLVEKLKDLGVDVLDDPWFDEEELSPETRHLADRIVSAQGRRPRARKNYESALHDALILRWIRWASSRGRHMNVLTSDKSLTPADAPPERGGRVVHLPALLHWLATAAKAGVGEVDFPRLYARLLRQQLLPLRRLFQTGHLLEFVDQERACKSLKPEEAHSIFEYFASDGMTKDPANPRDRAEIMNEVRARRTSSPSDWDGDPDDDWGDDVTNAPEEAAKAADAPADEDVQTTSAEPAATPAKRAARRKAICGLAITLLVAAATIVWALVDDGLGSFIVVFWFCLGVVSIEVEAGRRLTRRWVGPDAALLEGFLGWALKTPDDAAPPRP